MRRLAAAVLTIGLAACGGGEDTSGTLKDAACADLRDGMDLQAVANSGVRSGLSRERVASVLVLAVNEQCPEFEDDLQGSLVPSWLD